MMSAIDPFLARTHIAYFSMELAVRPEMHTYAGGLGILAGDTARSCADLEIPVVFVTLLSRAGYFRQEIDAGGRQTEQPDWWEPARWCTPLNVIAAVEIENKAVWVRPWLYVHTCRTATAFRSCCSIAISTRTPRATGPSPTTFTAVTRPTG